MRHLDHDANLPKIRAWSLAGADLGFSRGGDGFSKNVRHFDDLFFRRTKQAKNVLKHLKKTLFLPNILRSRQDFVKKNRPKKCF